MALQVKTDYPAQGVLQDLLVPLDQKAEMEIRVLGEKMVKLVKQDHRDLPDQMVSWDKLDRRERREQLENRVLLGPQALKDPRELVVTSENVEKLDKQALMVHQVLEVSLVQLVLLV